MTDDFKLAIGEENSILSGKLKRHGPIKDLSKLTYDDYIYHLKDNQLSQKVNLIEKINNSDTLFFKSTKKEFLIVLFYSVDKKIIIDKSSTTDYDSVIVYDKSLLKKDMTYFAKMVDFDFQNE